MEQDVQDPGWLTQVNKNEQDGHRDSRNGKQFAQDRHTNKMFAIVQVVRQNDGHRRSGDTYKKGELRDIQAPAHISAQPGNDQALRQLAQITKESREG